MKPSSVSLSLMVSPAVAERAKFAPRLLIVNGSLPSRKIDVALAPSFFVAYIPFSLDVCFLSMQCGE